MDLFKYFHHFLGNYPSFFFSERIPAFYFSFFKMVNFHMRKIFHFVGLVIFSLLLRFMWGAVFPYFKVFLN